MSFKKNLLRVFSANFIYTISSIIIGFVVPAILTIEGYADLKTYTLYMTYAGVLHLGFVDGIYLKYGGKDEDHILLGKIKGEHLFLIILQLFMTLILLFVSWLRKDMVLFLMSISCSFGLPLSFILLFILSFNSLFLLLILINSKYSFFY